MIKKRVEEMKEMHSKF